VAPGNEAPRGKVAWTNGLVGLTSGEATAWAGGTVPDPHAVSGGSSDADGASASIAAAAEGTVAGAVVVEWGDRTLR